jgi:hypothetical protein
MNDTAWQGVRYALISVGMFLAGRGKIDPLMVAPLADEIIRDAGAAVAAGTALWGFYVKWKTRAVPDATAARPDVPTVSAATGVVTK